MKQFQYPLRVFRSVHPSKRSPFLRHYKEPPVMPLTSQQLPQRHSVAPLVRKTEKVGKDGVGGRRVSPHRRAL